ncbi:MAG: hypothetical protein FGM44_03730 [Limnohabitans sp.]|jgi:hypothetical protein|nr:hypothetical protein [Limnohabitans sp.]
MEKIIVVVNDAEYALQMVAPMRNEASPTLWVLLVCPPKFTRHVNRWVSRQSLNAWRQKWSQDLIELVKPDMTAGGDALQWRCSQRDLPQQIQRLQKEFGTHRVLDARRPKFGVQQQPVSASQPVTTNNSWSIPGGVAMMGAVLIAAAD